MHDIMHDIFTKNNSDTMFGERIAQGKRKLKRHTAMVAAGFIRYHVLTALSEKPLSGSELIENIEKSTGGFWKPSPGSIYPLLSLLQDNGCISELPTENGMKRYELNENGKQLLQEQRKITKECRESMGFQQNPMIDFFRNIPSEKMAIFREMMIRGGKAMFQLSNALQDNYSEEAFDEMKKIMEDSNKKLEKLAKKIMGEKNE